MKEKRHFKRIAMDAPITLVCGDHKWHSRLLDVSLKGALIEAPDDWPDDNPGQCRLELQLDDEVCITMEGTVVHSENGNLGYRCDHIGLDSITHLKRLVELNLGDESLLERELAELAHSGTEG